MIGYLVIECLANRKIGMCSGSEIRMKSISTEAMACVVVQAGGDWEKRNEVGEV